MSDIIKKPVWLDCDPGHDDAFAIILAAHHPALELIGISTIVGNQTLEKTTQNAFKVAHIAGLPNDIPIIRGCGQSLCRHVMICPEIHGSTGLDGADVPEHPEYRTSNQDENFLWRIYQKIKQVNRPVTLIATGSLCNVALRLIVFPQGISSYCCSFFFFSCENRLQNVYPKLFSWAVASALETFIQHPNSTL